MIRAAAKNAAWVAVVTDPADYGAIARGAAGRRRDARLRARLAAKAFARTASYDAAIAALVCARGGRRISRAPRRRRAAARAAALRREPAPVGGALPDRRARPNIATARQVQGKELSYNNINDADAAFELVSDLPADAPAVVIIKHANPCGAAVGDDSRRGLREGAPLRSRLGLWRHRRGEPAARRGGGRGDHRHLHRGGRRAGRGRGGARDLRKKRRTFACSSPAAWPIRRRSRCV